MTRGGFRTRLALGVLVVWLAVGLAGPAAAGAAARTALVIGNAAYGFSPLENPINDARAMASALGELGFDVHLVEDASLASLRIALDRIREQPDAGGLGVFYYAGHAVQHRGLNYLLPTDLTIDAAGEDLPGNSLDITTVLNAMEDADFDVNVVILDACRDFPFGDKSEAFGDGLVGVAASGETLVAYATASGQVALDGIGPNSPYTAALVSALDLPGHDLYDVFRIVRGKVREATRGRQLPWVSGSIESHVVLREPERAPALEVAALGVDQVHWQTIKDSVDPADFERFALIHPASALADRAAERKARLLRDGYQPIAPIQVAAEVIEAPRARTLEVTPCDVWASDPYDPRRIADGVEWGLVNTRAAIRDCAAAVAEDPDDPRLSFNFARALDIAERFDEAASFYRRAAEQGYAAAIRNLGYMHRTGRGLPRDYERAAEYYYLAALQGLPLARNALAKLYELGWGVPQSFEESLRWNRLAAKDGFAPAMDALGNIYRSGIGVEVDLARAFAYYEAAAAYGDDNAMANLARMYRDRLGTEADLEQALHWYRLATESGNPYAPHHLARMVLTGEGMAREPRRALALFELAAERGNEWSYWEIGRLHESGALGEPDLDRAYYHYWLARAAGEERRNESSAQLAEAANGKLGELRPKLGEARALAAETRAESWLEANGLHQFTLISPY